MQRCVIVWTKVAMPMPQATCATTLGRRVISAITSGVNPALAGQALPVGRVGEPEDLAETYLYLMRERFSTGAMIVVDGESTLV